MEKRPIDTLLSNIQNVELILSKLGAVVASSVIYGYDGDESIKVSISIRHDAYFPDETSTIGCYKIENHRITYLFTPSIPMIQTKVAMYPLYRLLVEELLDSMID